MTWAWLGLVLIVSTVVICLACQAWVPRRAAKVRRARGAAWVGLAVLNGCGRHLPPAIAEALSGGGSMSRTRLSGYFILGDNLLRWEPTTQRFAAPWTKLLTSFDVSLADIQLLRVGRTELLGSNLRLVLDDGEVGASLVDLSGFTAAIRQIAPGLHLEAAEDRSA